ncbi:hypothetical protein CNY89_17190 [Amaricoccus sp. HAR-UPW-R2A-40]|nr:hypothetical protein CNY89_17190 [Amaricoccus sp. HAR-UPW-R2A-40]
MPGYGMAIFATPSAMAALDGMLDRASFEIAMGKGPVVAVEWTGGAATRAWLRKRIGKKAGGRGPWWSRRTSPGRA